MRLLRPDLYRESGALSPLPWAAVLLLLGCGRPADEMQLRKDIDELKQEVGRLAARQESLEKKIDSARSPAQPAGPAAEKAPAATAPISIPSLPVVKVGEGAAAEAEQQRRDPRPAGSGDVPEIQGLDDKAAKTDPGRHFAKAMQQFANGDCGNAVVTFEDFLRENPGHQKAPNAVFNIAECYFRRGEYAIALSEFTRLEQMYRDSKLVPSALLKAGICLKNLKDVRGAKEMFKRVLERHPDDEAAGAAGKELSRLK
jgi:tol-pal system protein YbgF